MFIMTLYLNAKSAVSDVFSYLKAGQRNQVIHAMSYLSFNVVRRCSNMYQFATISPASVSFIAALLTLRVKRVFEGTKVS